jgi:hypothetical protein
MSPQDFGSSSFNAVEHVQGCARADQPAVNEPQDARRQARNRFLADECGERIRIEAKAFAGARDCSAPNFLSFRMR